MAMEQTNGFTLLMAVEFSKEWAETKHRYIYTHHVHHKTNKDYAGITVESLKSKRLDGIIGMVISTHRRQ
jgi:hypothetical protein